MLSCTDVVKGGVRHDSVCESALVLVDVGIGRVAPNQRRVRCEELIETSFLLSSVRAIPEQHEEQLLPDTRPQLRIESYCKENSASGELWY